MGSVGFDGEVESQPGTSNCKKYKLPRTFLVDCDAVNLASVPKKLRSAIKKRGRESITSPLLISKKQRHVYNRVGTLKKDGAKKSKPKKHGLISKDEEEVAETLYALASLFSDTNKANQPGLNDDEPTGAKSSAILETGSSMNAVEDAGIPTLREESRKISSKVTLSTCHSPNLLDSKAEIVKLPSSPGGSGVESDLGFLTRLPAWFDSTNFSSHSISTEKCTRVAVQSKKSWKRSSAHIYISRLVKVLQISEKKEGSPEKLTRGGAHRTTGIDGRNCGVSFNGIIDSAAEKDSSEMQNDIFSHERLIQDRQLASETSTLCSAKEGYDFLSLGMEVCGLDASGGVSRAGQSHEAPKQLHASYVQSQNHSSVLFSLAQNGYLSTFHGHNSALAAQQVQLPQYRSSTVNGSFTARMRRQLDLQQQKRADQLPIQYSTRGVGSPHLPTGLPSTVNYAQALFPYQQLSPPQQPLMSISSSLPLPSVKLNLHRHRQFPLGFERNGATFYYENTNQHL